MKKLIPLLAILFAASLSAQDDNATPNRLYFKIGATEELTSVPLELHLDNATATITAVELYITLPDVAISLGAGELNSNACDTTHELVQGTVGSSHYISVASPSLATITAGESPLCVWHLDLSSLATGSHTITATGKLAVGIDDNAIVSYTASDQIETITIGNTTGIVGIQSTDNEGELEIYDLRGVPLSSPRAGAINIINGKKVQL